MDAMIVIHMQVGMLGGQPKHDLPDVIDRINRLAGAVRSRSGKVIWIQHCGSAGDEFEPNTPGWSLLPELNRSPSDIVVQTTLNDAFAGTDLESTLQRLAPDRVLVTGWATDFCVDGTLRATVARNHHVVAVSDGHTLADRPHLGAADVIHHHNWVWRNLLTAASIRIATASELLAEAGRG